MTLEDHVKRDEIGEIIFDDKPLMKCGHKASAILVLGSGWLPWCPLCEETEYKNGD